MNSLFIICIGIIRNNSLVGGRAWAEVQISATERITLYCTWQLSVLTTWPHEQVILKSHKNVFFSLDMT